MLKAARNALPVEGVHFVIPPDEGCQYSSSCLSCPLPVCKHDRKHLIKNAVEHGDEAPRYQPHEIPDRIKKPGGLPSFGRDS